MACAPCLVVPFETTNMYCLLQNDTICISSLKHPLPRHSLMLYGPVHLTSSFPPFGLSCLLFSKELDDLVGMLLKRCCVDSIAIFVALLCLRHSLLSDASIRTLDV